METRTSFTCLCFALSLLSTAPASQQGTTLASTGTGGVQAAGDAWSPSLSADGRYVAFVSRADNLVPGDTNESIDVFVRDRLTRTVTLASVGADGEPANGDCDYAWLSGDGRSVAFYSHASNLVAGDTNGVPDAFVRDLVSGTTVRVSVSSSGVQGDDHSISPALSANGRYVAFTSDASNLVAGDTNGVWDAFRHDLVTGTTVRISVSSTGAQGSGASADYPTISADGRYVAFGSSSPFTPGAGPGGLYVRDVQSGTTSLVSVSSTGVQASPGAYEPSLSADGRFVTFTSSASNLVSGDTNGAEDVFVRDLSAGTTTRVSVDSHGAQGNGKSYRSRISGNGRFVAFKAYASNLVSDDTNGLLDIFVRDRLTGLTVRANESSAGVQTNGYASQARISDDGRHVAFYSEASNLVQNDNNWSWDVFVTSFGKLARR